MNTMSLKDKATLAVVGMILLYVFAAGLWFLSQEAAWKKAAKNYKKACARYAEECQLIAQKSEWYNAYEEAKRAMPSFEAGKATDTTWLEKMDEIAKKHFITISKRQTSKETSVGDVFELEIDVNPWEGALESLVKFMHELENTDSGMFDIKALKIQPSSKKGYLRGSFTLTCAYMRE